MELNKADAYRLQKISEIQQEILREREKRDLICKKYQKSVKVVEALGGLLTLTSSGLSVLGVTFLSSVAAAPAATIVVSLSAGAGALSLISIKVRRILSLRQEKHAKIRTIAEGKLNSISDLVSKALDDNNISDSEYSVILSEFEKFNRMKEEVRSKTTINIDEATKHFSKT
jgi:hypothetical protein